MSKKQEFNPKYLEEKLKSVEEKGRWQGFFDGYKILGKENLNRVANGSFVGIGNHLSHFDYMHITKVFYDEGLLDEFPRITAGTNLRNILVKCLVADFDKCNVLWTDRQKMGDRNYILQWKEGLREPLDNFENLFVFPDAGRNWGDKPIRKPMNGLAKTIITSRYDHPILPVVFGYDNLIEEKYKDKIQMNRGGKSLVKKISYVYYDVKAFTSRVKETGEKGNAYIWFGQPKQTSKVIGEENRTMILEMKRDLERARENGTPHAKLKKVYAQTLNVEAKKIHEHLYNEIARGLGEVELAKKNSC